MLRVMGKSGRRPCYLDDASGAAAPGRATMEALARGGFPVEVLRGAVSDVCRDVELSERLAARGFPAEAGGES